MSFGKKSKNALRMASTGYLLGGSSGAMFGALGGFSNPNNTGAQLAQSSLNSLRNLPDYTYLLQDAQTTMAPGSDYAALLSQMGRVPTVESFVNNPLQQESYRLLMRGLNRQLSDAQKQLKNELNAGNQLGGSYAALRHSLLNQDQLKAQDNASLKSIETGMQGMQLQRQLLTQSLEARQKDLMNRLALIDAAQSQRERQFNFLKALRGR